MARRASSRPTDAELEILAGEGVEVESILVEEARKLAEGMMKIMSSLLGIVERETELVRGGNVREAMALEAQKSDMSRQYVEAIAHGRRPPSR